MYILVYRVILVIRLTRFQYNHFSAVSLSTTNGNFRLLATFLAVGGVQLLSALLSVIRSILSNIFVHDSSTSPGYFVCLTSVQSSSVSILLEFLHLSFYEIKLYFIWSYTLAEWGCWKWVGNILYHSIRLCHHFDWQFLLVDVSAFLFIT